MSESTRPVVLVVEDEPAVADSFETMLDDRYEGRKAVSGGEALEETLTIESVDSPSDRTGIGVGIAKRASEIGDDARNGIGLDVFSLSTVRRDASENRTFDFGHATTGRVAAAGSLGLWTRGTSSHDERTVSTIRGQFDYAAELRETESGDGEMCILGGEQEWRALKPV